MIFVHPSGPARVRANISDCDGVLITQADVSSIQYTVYSISPTSGKMAGAVEGHEGVLVPVDSIMTEVKTDEDNGLEYNFECLLSAKTHKPFPENNKNYEIELVFIDLNGEPHPKSILVRTKTI